VAFVLKGAAWLRARRRQLDVAVAVDNRTAALSANLGRIIGGPPVLLQVHEPGGALVGGGGPVRRRLASFVERLVGVLDEWAAAAVGAATFAGGRDAAGRADPVAVIPWCGVDLEVFAPRDRARARHELGWPVDGAVVLGRSEAVSTADAETFVTAMAGLKARRAAVTVAFLGPGYDLVRRAGERVGLEVLGRAAADEGRRALWCAGADVVVQLDGGARVAIPALEALACATPVVGAHGEGLLEALDGGRLGTIVPSGEARMLADAVERTICDPSARRRAATAGRPHVASLFGATAAFDDWVGLARLVAAGERTTCGGRPWGRRRRSQPSTPTGVPVTLLSSAAAPGGAERALAALAQELRGRGFAPRALLLAHGPVERWMEEAGCAVDVVPAPRRPILQMAALAPVAVRIAWHLHRHRPVALVSNHAKGHIFGGTAALLAGVPAVFWQQGVPVARLAERVAAKVPCRAVLASSDEAVEAQRKLVSRRPVVKVPLGIDVTAVASRRGSGRAMRSELAGRDEVLVGMVGRLERWKGQHVFLEAAANVAGRRAHVSFAVIGGAVLGWEGTYEEELHALGDRLGIADRVVFTGHQEDAIACMDALDVVVHASVEPEAFGLVVVEAMALGKPVVAAGAGGPLEIVEDGISGLLTPPGDAKALADAVVGLVDDPDRRLAMGRRAQDRARCFDQGRMAEAIAALLVAPRGGADGQLNGGTTDMRLVHCGTRAPGGS
jgi:glycosyltransferase involved in cell wall biosynthesis